MLMGVGICLGNYKPKRELVRNENLAGTVAVLEQPSSWYTSAKQRF